MLRSTASNLLSLLVFFPLVCYSAADPNPFANDYDEPNIFHGLPGTYGTMGAPEFLPDSNIIPTGMPASEPTAAISAPGEESDTGGMSAFAASASSSRSPQDFYCPQDNGAKFSTGGKCFELRCNTATNLRVGVTEEFPSTSLKQCAEACGRNSQCMACDIHLPGARNPNKCLLFRGTPANGKLMTDRNIHYWSMLNMDQCGSTYDDRDSDRDRYPQDRECAIDPQVVRRASARCDEQYNGARPTPLFNERGNPVCCGPVKNYDRNGRVVESCPPLRSDDRNRDDGSQYDDRNQDDDVGAQNVPPGSSGDGGGQRRMN